MLDPERRRQVVELVHEERGDPEVLWRIRAVRRRAVPDLVIQYHWDARDWYERDFRLDTQATDVPGLVV